MRPDSHCPPGEPHVLIALQDHVAPSMPTEHVIRRYWRLLRLRLQRNSAAPVRAGDRLRPATRKLLDSVAAPPAYGPLMEALEAAAEQWQTDASVGAAWLRVLVLPPCDNEDLISSWATRQGHDVLGVPPRGSFADASNPIDWDGLAGEGLLVVPQLERWFLRRRDGLAAVRSLIDGLGRLQRPCVVGCNSWAWAFLEQAAGAGLALPAPLTFEAFQAKHLRAWFSRLAQRNALAGAVLWHGALGSHPDTESLQSGDEYADMAAEAYPDANPAPSPTRMAAKRQADTRVSAAVDVLTGAGPDQPLVFRLSSTGANVLGDPPAAPSAEQHGDQSNNANPGPSDPSYLKRLAARSLGIPWVAWNLWRDGLHAAAEGAEVPDKVKETVADDGRTLWVSELPEFTLPARHERPALMVAHALLMHGSLSSTELQSVLPGPVEPGILAALQGAGYIEWCTSVPGDSGRDDKAEARVRPSAYPALRAALKTAGFPTGVI